jgi:hypothetical protein
LRFPTSDRRSSAFAAATADKPTSSSWFRGLCAIAAGAWGTAAAVHYHQLGLTLSHYDARAHLVVARRVFDSLIPGWQQVGAVWLPLPHLLNALPVQVDWLYRTGASAIAISILSMALAAWAIATLIHRATGSFAGGAVAAALLMVNPNVLYLQSTPMTEPLLFATTFLALALVGDWVVALSTPNAQFPTPNQLPTANLQPPSSRAAGWSLVAAVLTRYEAWPIVAAAIGLSFAVLLRRGWTMGAAARAVRGLALWPLWAIAAFMVNSKVTIGTWFIPSGFYIAENPAQGHPWLAWTQVWDGLVQLSGPVLPWIAVVSASAILVAFVRPPRSGSDKSTEKDQARPLAAVILPLALVACAAVPLLAYVKGHPVRIRYDVPLVAAAAALIGTAVALLPRRARGAAGAIVVALAVWQVGPFDAGAPVIVESQREAPNKRGRAAVTAYLDAHWDGRPIMMSMGSLGHYMHDLSARGFRVKDFLHEGNGELWTHAARYPRLFVEWIAIEERAEGGDGLHRRATHDPTFLRGYVRVAEGGGVALYRRTTP